LPIHVDSLYPHVSWLITLDVSPLRRVPLLECGSPLGLGMALGYGLQKNKYIILAKLPKIKVFNSSPAIGIL
jgi:hypothetical protein